MWSLLWLWGAGRGWGWVPPTLAYLGCSFPKRRACLYTFVPNLSAPPVNGSCAATEGLAMPFHHPCPRCPPPPPRFPSPYLSLTKHFTTRSPSAGCCQTCQGLALLLGASGIPRAPLLAPPSCVHCC